MQFSTWKVNLGSVHPIHDGVFLSLGMLNRTRLSLIQQRVVVLEPRGAPLVKRRSFLRRTRRRSTNIPTWKAIFFN